MTARESRRPTRPEDTAKLDQYLNGLRRDSQPLPGFTNRSGQVVLAKAVSRSEARRPVPTPIQGWFERHPDTGRSAHGHPHQRPDPR